MAFKAKQGRRYNEIDPEKKAMYKTLYLSGLPIAEVGNVLGGISSRTVYHHLQPLTPDEKAEHMKNYSIRDAEKRANTRKEKENAGNK